MRVNFKKIREELAKKCKAGPSGDYQDLWLAINELLWGFEIELRRKLELLEKRMKLSYLTKNQIVFASAQVQLLKEILGEGGF